ncbi:MAG: T9SS type A sorting domain-containing protein [Chitinophagales bacterium]|nr:T9SS type A sorting domain-containing protein [Chitinophagales bacterium]
MKGLFPILFTAITFFSVRAQQPNFQVYPNPFSQTLTSHWVLDSAEVVSVSVFDIVGRQVAIILPDTLLAGGNCSITSNLNYLNHGVYFVKLAMGDSVFLKKVSKVDNAVFTCPFSSNTLGDTIHLHFEIIDSLGDRVTYKLLNRWGMAEIEIDTILPQGSYDWAFAVSAQTPSSYVQYFMQDSSSCKGVVVVGNSTASVASFLNRADIAIQRNGSEVILQSDVLLTLNVIDCIGQRIVTTQSNKPFYLPKGLYFFVLTDAASLPYTIKYWQKN